jgi:uncharacterized protein YndB with AHSA1/START domain
MARWTKETTIKATPDKVFDYVADLTKHPEWASHDTSVTAQTPGPAKVGSVYKTVGHQFGTQNETVTVTDYEPGRKFGFESVGKIGTVRHGFELAPAGDSTRVTKWTEIVKASLMTKLMMPMISRKVPPGLDEDLKRIKAKLEA